MKTDWDLIIKIAVPFLTLIIGHFIDRFFAKRPNLISYLGHVSSFTLSDANKTQVYTHAIV
jgi:hypothetical protein